ncbi:MAG: hypothetical protein ACD_75C00864G0002 [uncultured bacterium]|nr:MAG: hypothetical protein ACD_75C00864G0002 [uncultured bacterium]
MEFETEQPHDGKGDEVGEWNRDGAQQHGAQIAQKKKDDDDGDEDRLLQRSQHIIDAPFDQILLGVAHCKMDEGKAGCKLCHRLFRGLDGVEGIAVLRPQDTQTDGLPAVAVVGGLRLLHAGGDRGDIAQVDDSGVLAADHQV